MSDKKSLFKKKKKFANFFFLDAKKENKKVVEKILKLIYRSTDRLKQKISLLKFQSFLSLLNIKEQKK